MTTREQLFMDLLEAQISRLCALYRAFPEVDATRRIWESLTWLSGQHQTPITEAMHSRLEQWITRDHLFWRGGKATS